MLELPRYSECNVVFALSYLYAPLALAPTQPLNLAHTITHPTTLGVCVSFYLEGEIYSSNNTSFTYCWLYSVGYTLVQDDFSTLKSAFL